MIQVFNGLRGASAVLVPAERLLLYDTGGQPRRFCSGRHRRSLLY